MNKQMYRHLEMLTASELAEILNIDEELLIECSIDDNNAPPAIFVADEARYLIEVVEKWVNEKLPDNYKINKIL
jgi:hypothetical protein